LRSGGDPYAHLDPDGVPDGDVYGDTAADVDAPAYVNPHTRAYTDPRSLRGAHHRRPHRP
jgi:hypothetical protein